MTTPIFEAIHQWLGWCPNRRMTPVRMEMAWQEVNSPVFQAQGTLVTNEVIVDYGSTGLSIRLFILILAGTTTGLFAIMRYGLFETWSSLGILMMSIFILGVAVRMAYQDIKKATIEFTKDAIAVWRPLFRPLIIAKDTITTIEIRKNIHHSWRWLFRGAIILFIVGIIPSILFSGQSLFISRVISQVSFSVFVVYYLAVVVFFGLLFYHQHIRSRYSHVLAIHTKTKKIVGLYIDDPGKMSEILSKWQAGAV
jgi:hypothetical protein